MHAASFEASIPSSAFEKAEISLHHQRDDAGISLNNSRGAWPAEADADRTEHSLAQIRSHQAEGHETGCTVAVFDARMETALPSRPRCWMENAKASSIVGVPDPTHNGAAARSTSSEGGVLNSALRSAQSARPLHSLHSLSSGSPSSKHSPITKFPTKRASARRNAVSRAHGTSVIFSLSAK